MTPGVTARPIVVIGAPGSGKSTVGRRLARHWGVAFHDTDQLIEESVGKSVSDIFVEEGEPAFRAREREIVAQALAEFDGVLALGGGAVIDDQTRQRLAQAPCLWLRVGVSEAARRVGLNTSRPLLLGNVRGTLMTLLDERTPMYEEVATWTIDTDGRSADEVVEAVVAALEVA
ncbi:MAG: shikimate kinase [Candidatus Nanopelagicales bacterium]